MSPYPPGSKLIQRDLATTLGLIADRGPDVFYRGDGQVAQAIVRDMKCAAPDGNTVTPGCALYDGDVNPQLAATYPNGANDKGLMTAQDLETYRPVWATPLMGTYRGYQIIGMPPPSSGGQLTIEVLNLLEGYPLNTRRQTRNFKFGQADSIHVLAEAEKIAWADHEAYIADPAFLTPSQQNALQVILGKGYAQARRNDIDLDHANNATVPSFPSSSQTNHISVIDKDGNAVAVTTTLSDPFGSGVTVPGTGVLLNNELEEFSARGTINEPNGGKKPRSHQTPTIVVGADAQGVLRPVLVTGGAGGPTIPMGVVQHIVNVVDFGLDLFQAIDAKRVEARAYNTFSCDGVPCGNVLFVEAKRFDGDVLKELTNRGHKILTKDPFGCTDGTSDYACLPILNSARARFNSSTAKWQNEAVIDSRNGNPNPIDLTFGDNNGAMAQSDVPAAAGMSLPKDQQSVSAPHYHATSRDAALRPAAQRRRRAKLARLATQ